mgnify:CR=1 FL=1
MEFLAAIVLFGLAFAGLALGVMLKGKQVSGGCGGDVHDKDGNLVVEGNCACGKKQHDRCETDNPRMKYGQIDLVDRH